MAAKADPALSAGTKKEILGILNEALLGKSVARLRLYVATTGEATGGENVAGIGPKLEEGVNGNKVGFITRSKLLAQGDFEALSVYPQFVSIVYTGMLNADINNVRQGKYGAVYQMKLAFIEQYRGGRLNNTFFNSAGNVGYLSGYYSGMEIIDQVYDYIWTKNMY